MKICQYVIAIQLVFSLFSSLHMDFYGRKAKEPFGFYGAVMTLVIMALVAWIYITAGVFSELP